MFALQKILIQKLAKTRKKNFLMNLRSKLGIGGAGK